MVPPRPGRSEGAGPGGQRHRDLHRLPGPRGLPGTVAAVPIRYRRLRGVGRAGRRGTPGASAPMASGYPRHRVPLGRSSRSAAGPVSVGASPAGAVSVRRTEKPSPGHGRAGRVRRADRVGLCRQHPNVAPGDMVAVYGVGGIGINAVQGARHAGARNVVAIDPLENKREKPMELGHSRRSLKAANGPSASRRPASNPMCEDREPLQRCCRSSSCTSAKRPEPGKIWMRV